MDWQQVQYEHIRRGGIFWLPPFWAAWFFRHKMFSTFDQTRGKHAKIIKDKCIFMGP